MTQMAMSKTKKEVAATRRVQGAVAAISAEADRHRGAAEGRVGRMKGGNGDATAGAGAGAGTEAETCGGKLGRRIAVS